MADEKWHDLGSVEELSQAPLRQVIVGRTRLAVSHVNGEFGVVSGACNHVGGPLGEGTLDGDYIVCPWHAWKFHRTTGVGEPGFEADVVPRHDVRVVAGRVEVNLEPATKRQKSPHAPHALARDAVREPGPLRVVGISATVIDRQHPRYSTSEALLETALEHAREKGAEARILRLDQLKFRSCEGYYSKSAHACTWPCSITQMDPADEMEQVYEAMVHWADVMLVSTPIRWGSASSQFFKMIERLNCVQNQVTIRDRVLLKNKVASFIIMGGQDNIQAVAGHMLMFFAEIGCHFPQFPFIAHSRGWDSEDMEQNVAQVQGSASLREGAQALVERALATAALLIAADAPPRRMQRGGRKARGARTAERTPTA